MIRVRTVGADGGPSRLASMMTASDPFFNELAVVADISAATAKAQPRLVPEYAPGVRWPMWQIRTRFTAGSTKSGTIVIHSRDRITQQWHASALISIVDAAAVAADVGQVIQFEAPADSDALAIQVDLDTADDRPHITVRGCAYVQVELT